MTSTPPTTIVWLRQDLRVSDQAALYAAAQEGPVVPLYVLDEETEGASVLGGAQRWWLHHSLTALDASLRKRGAALVLRRGRSAEVVAEVARESGAARVHALHHYEPWHKAAQAEVAATLDLVLHDGNYLAPPESVLSGQGQRYRIFTPWYRKLLEQMPPPEPLPALESIPAPGKLPASEALADWNLLPTRPDWAKGFAEWTPGEKGAHRAWRAFEPHLARYKHDRDFPGKPATSRLSPHLHFGEISPRWLWHACADRHGAGPDSFRSELGWREHGINLLDQMADYPQANGRPLFDRFPWRYDAAAERDFAAWCKGRTGYPVVDAAMRELWQTGWMHNRMRMVTASFLTKHLLIDWRRGERWFRDTLLDADAGSNAMNWQYVAGSGVDAPAFSRIMAPRLQSEKFAMGDYVRRFVPELAALDDAGIDAAHGAPSGVKGYPPPIVGHEAARARALAAWEEARAAAGESAEA